MVEVERNESVVRFRDFAGSKRGCPHRLGDRQRDAGEVEDPGGGDGVIGKISGAIEAGRRPAPGIGEAPTSRVRVDETNAGRIAGFRQDVAMIDAFSGPESAHRLAEHVVANRGQITGFRALPGGGDDRRRSDFY